MLLKRYYVSLSLIFLLVAGTLGANSSFIHRLAVIFTDDPWHIWLQGVWLSMFIAGSFTGVLLYDLGVALALFAWIFFYSEPRISRLSIITLLVLGNFIGSLIPKLLYELNTHLITVDATHNFSQRDSGISSAALCLGSFVAVKQRNVAAMILIIVLFAGLTITQPETVWYHLPPMLIGAVLALISKKSNN